MLLIVNTNLQRDWLDIKKVITILIFYLNTKIIRSDNIIIVCVIRARECLKLTFKRLRLEHTLLTSSYILQKYMSNCIT